MEDKIKMTLNSPDENGECEAIELELEGLTDEIDARLNEIDDTLFELDEKIDKLTNHADIVDCVIAAASGILTGILDAVFVGEWDFAEGREWASDKVNKYVESVAKLTGYKGDGVDGAIKHLEKKYGAPSDSVMSSFGGARQHHLRDFSHHASYVGLFFSLLTQFTKKVYGTDKNGNFTSVDVVDTTLIGDTFLKKILFGGIYWVLHMASDMAGSKKTPSKGTGVTGPFLSLAKLLSAIFKGKDKDEVSKISVKISKLFNGTMLAEHDEYGKIVKNKDGKPSILQMDLRGEIGVVHQIAKQSIPVVVNETLVRGFYFIRRMIVEWQNKGSFSDIDWKTVIPFNNRTVERMMTIASGTFTVIDAIDTIIKGNVLRLNFVGIGRFALALGTDTIMGLRKGKREKEKLRLKNEALYLMGAKLYRGEELLWTAVKDADESIASLNAVAQKLLLQVSEDLKETEESILAIERIDKSEIESKNVGLLDDVLDGLN